MLDLVSHQWRQIPVDERCPLQRFGHRIAAATDGRLWMLGGKDELGTACRDLHSAELRPNMPCR